MIIFNKYKKKNIMIITWSKNNKKGNSSLKSSFTTDDSSLGNNNIEDVSFLSDSSFLGLIKQNETICNSFSLSEDTEESISLCEIEKIAPIGKHFNLSYVLKHFVDEIDNTKFVTSIVALYEMSNDFVIKELNQKLIESINKISSSKNSVDIVMKAMEVSDREDKERIVRRIKEYTNNLYGL